MCIRDRSNQAQTFLECNQAMIDGGGYTASEISFRLACMKTYASDSNCYVPELPGVHLDLDVANERDPSHGR